MQTIGSVLCEQVRISVLSVCFVLKAQKLKQQQEEAEEAERLALMDAQRAELDAIQRRKQHVAVSWTDK